MRTLGGLLSSAVAAAFACAFLGAWTGWKVPWTLPREDCIAAIKLEFYLIIVGTVLAVLMMTPSTAKSRMRWVFIGACAIGMMGMGYGTWKTVGAWWPLAIAVPAVVRSLTFGIEYRGKDAAAAAALVDPVGCAALLVVLTVLIAFLPVPAFGIPPGSGEGIYDVHPEKFLAMGFFYYLLSVPWHCVAARVRPQDVEKLRKLQKDGKGPVLPTRPAHSADATTHVADAQTIHVGAVVGIQEGEHRGDLIVWVLGADPACTEAKIRSALRIRIGTDALRAPDVVAPERDRLALIFHAAATAPDIELFWRDQSLGRRGVVDLRR